MSAEHPGWTRFGVTYVCDRCMAAAEILRAIERGEPDTARFIAENGPAAHGEGCERAAAPMFTGA